MTGKRFTLSTLGGDVKVEFLDSKGFMIKVDMGKASFICVNIGNPHCVIPMNNISEEKAKALGPFVENSSNFPNRINMQLLKVIDRNNISIEIYERGAGYTLASGTSSSAAAAVAYRLGLVDEEVEVHSPGGKLHVRLDKEFNVQLTGQVECVGKFELSQEFISKL